MKDSWTEEYKVQSIEAPPGPKCFECFEKARKEKKKE